jgi:hypothetical protein
VNFSGIGWRFGNWVACMVGGLPVVWAIPSVYGPGHLALHWFGVCFEMNTVSAR